MMQRQTLELGKRRAPSNRLSTAVALEKHSKVKDREQENRKKLIQLEAFVAAVMAWQEARPPLKESNKNLELLILLFLGELEEIEEHRQNEGLPGYDFKSERGETIDTAFFLASLTTMLQSQFNGSVDYQQALFSANGQANGSAALEKLREVGGNLQENSFEKDLQYLWTLWVSYLIHMKHPVNPNRVLHEYTIPKNNGNYVGSLLRGNPLFRDEFGRRMNREEKKAYFAHYRKATRLIRDFILKYVDASVEHTGLRSEHYEPYTVFIYSFMRFSSIGLTPIQSLDMLEDQLFADYGVPRSDDSPRVLRSNRKLPN